MNELAGDLAERALSFAAAAQHADLELRRRGLLASIEPQVLVLAGVRLSLSARLVVSETGRILLVFHGKKESWTVGEASLELALSSVPAELRQPRPLPEASGAVVQVPLDLAPLTDDGLSIGLSTGDELRAHFEKDGYTVAIGTEGPFPPRDWPADWYAAILETFGDGARGAVAATRPLVILDGGPVPDGNRLYDLLVALARGRSRVRASLAAGNTALADADVAGFLRTLNRDLDSSFHLRSFSGRVRASFAEDGTLAERGEDVDSTVELAFREASDALEVSPGLLGVSRGGDELEALGEALRAEPERVFHAYDDLVRFRRKIRERLDLEGVRDLVDDASRGVRGLFAAALSEGDEEDDSRLYLVLLTSRRGPDPRWILLTAVLDLDDSRRPVRLSDDLDPVVVAARDEFGSLRVERRAMKPVDAFIGRSFRSLRRWVEELLRESSPR